MRPLLSVFIAFGIGCADLIEPLDSIDGNDTPETATPIEYVPETARGHIESASDLDYYRFPLAQRSTVTIDLSIPENRDYNLILYDARDSALTSSQAIGDAPERIDLTLDSGDYTLRIFSANGTFSETQFYRLSISQTDTASAENIHLTLGNPSSAETNVADPENYLLQKTQYTLSYNRTHGIPNWVAWHMNSGWLGIVSRQNDFRSDDLPAGWYEVKDGDYSGSGYDRGHLCPSGDRTATASDNASTFFMTNIMPQAPDNNQGPWAELESYCRDLTAEGKELYIFAGGYDSLKTIASGKVTVPSRVWKIIVVMDGGNTTIAGLSTGSRVIAVDLPNVQGIRNDHWKNYRVSVNTIEDATGFDFLSKVPPGIQNALESEVDDE